MRDRGSHARSSRRVWRCGCEAEPLSSRAAGGQLAGTGRRHSRGKMEAGDADVEKSAEEEWQSESESGSGSGETKAKSSLADIVTGSYWSTFFLLLIGANTVGAALCRMHRWPACLSFDVSVAAVHGSVPAVPRWRRMRKRGCGA